MTRKEEELNTNVLEKWIVNTLPIIEEPIGNWQSALSEEPLANLIIE